MRERIDQMRRRAARYLGVQTVTVAPACGILSLSFDDFPASAWTEAAPVLAEHGIKATYYVAGGLSGGTNIGKPQFEVEHLQAAYAAGHEIGCHTFDHVSALRLSPEDLTGQLARNAAWVAERLDGHVMTSFAWPFGDVALGAKAVIDQRFQLGRGVRDGVNAGRADRVNLQAIGLESRRLPHYDLEGLVARAADASGWLIAYGHDVESAPTPYGCTPEDLDRLIRLAKTAGLEILPVGEAWERLGGDA
ncbi:MAG TPA: polysaccharide deacetylase family protein [Brevundimonas sp.]|nr:polysaccharide deacetylase family protein [Brevundimonas sp.]